MQVRNFLLNIHFRVDPAVLFETFFVLEVIFGNSFFAHAASM